jgi:ABC-type transporter Mla subunit MlaD
MSEAWRSFWIGTVAAVGIAVIAGVVLNVTAVSTGEKYATSSTRL